MSKTKKVLAVAVGILVVGGGMGFTYFYDYLPWKHAETDNFGHGPGEIGAMGIVNKMFQDDGAGVRINYPQGWKSRLVWGLKGWKPETEVVVFTEPAGKAKVTISRIEVFGSMTDLADKLEKDSISPGWTGLDRQYISGKEDITILTWQIDEPNEESRMKQIALAKNGNLLVTVEAECSLTEWKAFLGIFWEMYKSLVII